MKTVHLLRKPLGSTVAACALNHGTGGLNIDRCRVAAHGEVVSTHSKPAEAAKGNGIFGAYGSTATHQKDGQVLGRWPGNLVLQHQPGCEHLGVRKVKGHQGYPNGPKGKPDPRHGWGARRSKDVRPDAWESPATDPDGNETIPAWECVDGCLVADLDEQSGVTKGVVRKPTGNPIYPTGGGSMVWNPNSVTDTTERGFADAGGAARFFHQFPQERVKQPSGRVKNFMLPKELREYLQTMVSPDHLDDCNTLVIANPSDFDWAKHEDGTVHAILTESDNAVGDWIGEALRVMKPGGHLLLASEDTGFKGACAGEDAGFEVRDCILVADSPEDRLHYVAKPSRAEREAGCASIEAAQRDDGRKEGNPGGDNPRNRGVQKRHNSHPTVKPVEVMRRLLETVPKEGLVVDPFLGSGTTMIACTKTGHSGIGIEREEEYIQIADARVRHWNAENQGWNRASIESEAPKVEQEEQSLDDFFGWGE